MRRTPSTVLVAIALALGSGLYWYSALGPGSEARPPGESVGAASPEHGQTLPGAGPALQPATEESRVELESKAEHTLHVVRILDHKPVTNARAMVTAPGATADSVWANSRGRLTLEGTAGEIWAVQVRAPGYEISRVTCGPDSTDEPQLVELSPLKGHFGRVLSAEGEGVVGATVAFDVSVLAGPYRMPTSGGESAPSYGMRHALQRVASGSAQTGDGGFFFLDVPGQAGEVSIRAFTTESWSEREVRLPAERDIGDWVLRASSEVQIRLIEGDDKAVAGADLRVESWPRDLGTGGPRTLVSSDDGAVTTHVLAGDALDVGLPEGDYRIVRVTGAAFESLGARQVRLLGTWSECTLRLERTAQRDWRGQSIRGTVHGRFNEEGGDEVLVPLGGARIIAWQEEVIGDEPPWKRTLKSAEDTGEFRIPLPAAWSEVHLHVERGGFESFSTTIRNRGASEELVAVELSADDSAIALCIETVSAPVPDGGILKVYGEAHLAADVAVRRVVATERPGQGDVWVVLEQPTGRSLVVGLWAPAENSLSLVTLEDTQPGGAWVVRIGEDEGRELEMTLTGLHPDRRYGLNVIVAPRGQEAGVPIPAIRLPRGIDGECQVRMMLPAGCTGTVALTASLGSGEVVGSEAKQFRVEGATAVQLEAAELYSLQVVCPELGTPAQTRMVALYHESGVAAYSYVSGNECRVTALPPGIYTIALFRESDEGWVLVDEQELVIGGDTVCVLSEGRTSR